MKVEAKDSLELVFVEELGRDPVATTTGVVDENVDASVTLDGCVDKSPGVIA
jgi:hypothetical protein